jgi:hypothetical protein
VTSTGPKDAVTVCTEAGGLTGAGETTAVVVETTGVGVVTTSHVVAVVDARRGAML